MLLETQTLHEMYDLLRECSEDEDCGCGCSSEKELDEKPKKKVRESTADRIMTLIAEARRRRKIGLKRFRNMARMMSVRSAQAPKLRAASKAAQAVRAGPSHNRHRR